MALPAVENWDEDLDLEGPIFAHSVSTHHASISSRISMRSESAAGEDDWQVDLTPNDDTSTSKAISSAKQAGIPIPSNVPSSALLGGAIKRLGKKPSRREFKDDWGDDLDISAPTSDTLKLKLVRQTEKAVAANEDGFDDDLGFNDDDEFSDWAEGSLGIRNAGTKNALRQRHSSLSGMSPSMGSCVTADSEDDGLDGLIIPMDMLNLQAALKKRQEAEQSDKALIAPEIKPAPSTPVDVFDVQKEDFFADMDFGAGDAFDLKKKTLNRNVKPRWAPTKDNNHTPKTQTTIVFNDKNAATRIPRPVTSSKPSRLEPVLESGATNISKARRPEPTTTSAQLLRSKRSVSGLKEQPLPSSKPQPLPYQPQGNVHSRLYPSNPRITQYTSRREPDFARAQSPPLRPHSRLSHAFTPDTPTRQRRELAPPSLAREAAAKRAITKPARRRNFGDGTELDTFDDLPTSAAKESKFVKQPATRAPKTLRTQPSLSKLVPLRDRMTTPLPPSTPRSPAKTENLPRFARDTAASRIAREQKLGHPKPRNDQPLAPRTNWAAPIAARTPHASPTANRIRRGPQLVAPMGKENIRHFQDDAAKKGMHWNADMCRWEGNESALLSFDSIAAISPPRPALITNITATKGVQVVGGMVFDPQRMCWLKMGTRQSDVHSPSVDTEDDDPFRDIEDLPDSKPNFDGGAMSGTRGAGAGSEWLVSEEFDLGPEFIRRQRDEETVWRSKVNGWFGEGRSMEGEGYKWAIRDIAGTVQL